MEISSSFEWMIGSSSSKDQGEFPLPAGTTPLWSRTVDVALDLLQIFGPKATMRGAQVPIELQLKSRYAVHHDAF
ncbi:hypothetical protein O9K51_11209 [Purpureocillium lavendulum]|uniref:Uncharacterized protein n=1 Tax=Purpureocillium lavendulum TaxID=1247861 RepID=A0AB34FCQ6_9HYPO|nr:hypothetical protein O9K51_11209 [Purpureocillium lavendulum]